MALLHVSELPAQRTEEAFVLVRLASDWSERDWREWLRPVDGRQRGVLSVTALGGVLLGLAAYEARRGRLDVPLFAAFELGSKGATREALRDGLESLGEQLRCEAICYSEESRGLLVSGPA